MQELEETFNVPVIESYGMTEASHQMASNPLPPVRRKPKSVGLPAGPQILEHVDVLIAGRFDRNRRTARGLRGSANQRIHLLTHRYELQDLEQSPEAEIIIDPAGNVRVSGLDPSFLSPAPDTEALGEQCGRVPPRTRRGLQ